MPTRLGSPEDSGTSRQRPIRVLGATTAVVVGLFLVGRAMAELFVVHYSIPASYSHAWGGPTLAGVLAVHTGPAIIIMVAATMLLRRRIGSVDPCDPVLARGPRNSTSAAGPGGLGYDPELSTICAIST